jgi:hypothetical protein
LKSGAFAVVQYGCRVTSEPYPLLPDSRSGSLIKIHNKSPVPWTPMSIRLPWYISNHVMPRADSRDPLTIVAAVKKRIVNPLPIEMDYDAIAELGQFAREWMRNNLTPLPYDTDVSVEGWLAEARYPLWRKEELASLMPVYLTKQDFVCKSFIKDEAYSELKFGRTINPRSDKFKVFTGPIFHRIEKELFKLPCFVKYVPVSKRSEYVINRIFSPAANYFATDYTSFESSFTPAYLREVELPFYEYMTQNVRGQADWNEAVSHLGMQQKLIFKHVTATTQGTRMSGDMCTSLGNGFANMILMLFAAHKLNLGETYACFEGDDGIGRFASGRLPDPDFFLKLGFRVKLITLTDPSQASFCGILADIESKQQITDIREALVEFGWAKKAYVGAKNKTLLALLRAKALSFKCLYPGCPILSFVARRIVHLTREIDHRVVLNHRATDWWERMALTESFLTDIIFEEPTRRTRLLVEETQGISVELQLEIEARVMEMQLGSFDLESLRLPCLWRQMYDDYVTVRTNDAIPIIAAASRKFYWADVPSQSWDGKIPASFFQS